MRVKLPTLYKVIIIESELGWGQEVDDVIFFDNEKEAKEYVTEYNKKNTGKNSHSYYTIACY